MANVKISELSLASTPLTGAEELPVVQSGVTYKTRVTDVIASKQDVLVSGTNIKSINSTSLLGSGDVAVQPTLVSGTNIKTINGSSILGSGDLVVGGSANPSVIALSATDGTAVTGTTNDTLSRSLLIPANTFTGNGMLEILTRSFKTGSAGNQSLRAYTNTSASLTGATLIATFMAASSQVFPQGIRTFRINSNTLTGTFASTSGNSDYVAANGKSSTTFNTTVDNYIIISIQLTNAADSSVVEMARAIKYE